MINRPQLTGLLDSVSWVVGDWADLPKQIRELAKPGTDHQGGECGYSGNERQYEQVLAGLWFRSGHCQQDKKRDSGTGYVLPGEIYRQQDSLVPIKSNMGGR